MFSIKLEMKWTELTGLDALDWRRERGLSDGVKARVDWFSKTYMVDEAFARKYFRRDETQATIGFTINDLVAEDIVAVGDYNVSFRVNLSQKAAEDIFAQYRKNEVQVEDLTIEPFERWADRILK